MLCGTYTHQYRPWNHEIDPNSWDAVKAVLRGKFIALNAHIRKKKSKVSHLSIYFRKLETEEQINSQVSRKEEIIWSRAEISVTENRKQ